MDKEYKFIKVQEMTMRYASPYRTACEMFRYINDLCQDDTKKDNEIRKLAAEGLHKAKRLAKELHDANPAMSEETKNWYEKNEGRSKLLDKRLDDSYLQEYSKGDIGKIKIGTMKNKLVRWLNHYRYGREMFGMAQSMMIGIIFMEQFDINRYFYIGIIPVTVFGFVFVGYLLRKYDMFSKDLGYRTSENPFMTDLKEKIYFLYEIEKKKETK